MLTLKLLRLALLFLAPFILYGGWLAIARRRAKGHPPGWNDAPLMWLSTAGLVLVIPVGFACIGRFVRVF